MFKPTWQHVARRQHLHLSIPTPITYAILTHAFAATWAWQTRIPAPRRRARTARTYFLSKCRAASCSRPRCMRTRVRMRPHGCLMRASVSYDAYRVPCACTPRMRVLTRQNVGKSSINCDPAART
eukprot:6183038-Pleurochrysis_carterae.AAC.1